MNYIEESLIRVQQESRKAVQMVYKMRNYNYSDTEEIHPDVVYLEQCLKELDKQVENALYLVQTQIRKDR